ncbi:MAG: hypothetical protein KAG53_09855 [Endozoicomonadaceae bacterium]|nr:hypothetical protein [Endozoicomonadaceae bacterium]
MNRQAQTNSAETADVGVQVGIHAGDDHVPVSVAPYESKSKTILREMIFVD